MSVKLNRDAILREMLTTLVKGWGRKAVYDALNEILGAPDTINNRPAANYSHSEPRAVKLIEELPLSGDRKALLLQLARNFDGGTAFPKMSDVRAFLASHHQNSKDLKSRDQAFRKMVPLLAKMSEKGLMRVISRSQHSGPAELGSISDAIKGAGENLRGPNSNGGNP